MRVTCPACRAPYFVPCEPPTAPRCPNCEAAYDPATALDAPPPPPPEPAGRGVTLTVVGALHFLPGAAGLYVAVAPTELAWKVAVEPWFGFGYVPVFGLGRVVVGLMLAAAWFVSGVGVLARARFARYTAIALSAMWAFGAVRSGGGVAATVVLLTIGYIWAAVIACWNEFR